MDLLLVSRPANPRTWFGASCTPSASPSTTTLYLIIVRFDRAPQQARPEAALGGQIGGVERRSVA